MTVDLSKLKVGDIIKLRNDDMYKVDGVEYVYKMFTHPFCLSFNNTKIYYAQDGSYIKLHGVSDFDIVEIIPKNTKETQETKQEYVSTIAGVTGKGDLSKKPHPRALNPDLLKETANCFRFGQLKHGVDNFRKMEPEAAGEIFDALIRHLLDYMAGETHAKDSGLHHLAHADANLHMLYRIIKRSSDKEVLEVISGGDLK